MAPPLGLALALAAALGTGAAAAAESPTGYTSCLDRGQVQAVRPEVRPRAPPPEPTVREREIQELARSAQLFEDLSREYRQEIQVLVERKYDERRRFLSDNYEQAIRDLEVLERKERQDAIAQFEEFLSRYPDDPSYTPDAMFRLAELYYEWSNDEYNQAVAEWRERVKAAVAEGADPPAEPVKSYSRSISLYQRLLTGFPGYRFLHGIYYLLGYCLGEMGQGEEARRVFLTLIERYPESSFVPEAWVRLGDWYFDEVKPDALARAAEAFSRMYAYPSHALYARAIYKLGWTYYRMDDFPRAVASFVRLLDFYAAESKKSGKPPSGDVWPEAVQYTAISFSDATWGGVQKARAFFESLGGRPYEAEIYRRLGDILFDETKFAQAVEAYELVIARNPLSPDAPKVQAKIVTAWQRDRRFEREAEARERLVAVYGERSAWWQRNQGDPDLVKEVRDLWERSLMRAATFHHAQAQAHKKEGRLELAVPEYREAARAYGEYLARFPHSKNAYELAYSYADCLYNSLDFARSAQVYADVRDDPADNKYFAEAGLSAVIAWESEVTRLRAVGQLPELKVLRSADRREGQVVRPERLPLALVGLVRESDTFRQKIPGHAKGPAIAYKAGEVFYVYNQYEEARCRFEDVVARWPETEVAQYAANLIIESYLAVKDWAAVEQTSARLQGLQVARNAALAGTLQKFKLGGRFNRAMQLMEQKQYDEAGRLFLALVAEDPKHEFADKALYNAASCLEGARRFESALRLYERVQSDYPSSSFADDALFRVAWNAENTYDFDKAVDRYMHLVERYPKSKHRKDALYNAARSLENLQLYDPSARAFARYAQLYPDAEDAARTQYHAALIYEKTREWPRAVRALQEFQTRFARSRESELLVQSHLKIATAHRELGNEKAARASHAAAVAEFRRRGLTPEAHTAAAAAAAESQFRLAESEFERYDRIQLPATTNEKKLKAALQAKFAELNKVAPLYNEVKSYKRPDWTLAAFYRQAYLLERLAQTLYEAPPPPEYKKKGMEEYLAIYQDKLAQFAQPYEDKAVSVYVQALAAARELHVKNEWTRKIAESLARYRPREYPVLKEAKGRMLLEDVAPYPLAAFPDGRGLRSEPVARSGAAPPAGAARGEGASTSRERP